MEQEDKKKSLWKYVSKLRETFSGFFIQWRAHLLKIKGGVKICCEGVKAEWV